MTAGSGLSRLEGHDKVTGAARYAYEYPVEDVLYVWPVGATVASGTVTEVDSTAALADPEVVAVIDHTNAPRLLPAVTADELVLQSPTVAYRGQIVAAVVATTIEAAQEGAEQVLVRYVEHGHKVVLDPEDPDLEQPETTNAGFPGTSIKGDVDAALAAADVVVDTVYTTPAQHNNPMETVAIIARWDGERLLLHDSNQGPWAAATAFGMLWGIPPSQVDVVTEHVGGGFGSKVWPTAGAVVATVAARVTGRPCKLMLTRQQMYTMAPARTATRSRIRLGARSDGTLTAIDHDALQYSSVIHEFVEQTGSATRTMYASDNLRIRHRLARLNLPTPRVMRAPGKTPGMFALESAMDELAYALDLDPLALRLRNEPATEPASGLPFDGRHLVDCLQAGADKFGWASRDPTPGARRRGRWLFGTGLASAMYPVYQQGGKATARAEPDGTFDVWVAAVDIGTGSRTALWQAAVDALGVPPSQVSIHIGHSAYGQAALAGGSAGTASWGGAVRKACLELSRRVAEHGGAVPSDGLEVTADTAEDQLAPDRARHSYGAHFCAVRVDADTGQVRVDRLLGVFAHGHALNARTTHSQLLGGMVMGVSMALCEQTVVDPRLGLFVNHDLAQYHVATNADIRGLEAHSLERADDDVTLVGGKGIGELGIVGSAAAVANAVFHATGVRVRDLPITPERVRAR
ncbi:xanthine dehydrogenase [Asanoa ishikariensis]|uniref:Xanthine dehydrogenase, molybdenum binding subunit apoprotein n=1 Tax=Asanoa ishikariensis TaxID=137265 RepID=A0A1H3UHR8_9ACTN|nr:xanthine dehydrogenase family protein molybdopterin-binding subunit [Asanoa ishikariensis]GIF63472.1 xanthine dehydrogenase [Asanoa ishikariensis]SDZ62042.1 xanthine dehydrogenase, molybdenum binding subunit apoprotein [Asanoa ishikariensis]